MNNRHSAKRPRRIELESPDMMDTASVTSCTPDIIERVIASSVNDNFTPVEQRAVQELTEREAALELRVSVDTLRRERAAGKIGFAQRRRLIFYPVRCIVEYRERQVVEACSTLISVDMGQSKTGTSFGAKARVRSAGRRALAIKN